MYLDSSTKVGAYFLFPAPYHTSTHPFLSAGQYHSHLGLCEKGLKHPRLRSIRSANLTSHTGQYEVREHVFFTKNPLSRFWRCKKYTMEEVMFFMFDRCRGFYKKGGGGGRGGRIDVVDFQFCVLGKVAFYLIPYTHTAPDSLDSCFLVYSKLSS